MTAATNSTFTPNGEADGAADWSRALRERQLEMLQRLAEEGMRLAEAIASRVTAPEPDAAAPPLEDLQAVALAHARVARTVRLTLLLQSKIAEDIQAAGRLAVQDAREDARQANLAAPQLRHQRRAHVQRIVGRVAMGQRLEREVVERLMREAVERLDQDEIYGLPQSRPLSELIEHICRDLRLTPDWSRLAKEAWAQAEIDSGAPGAPLAQYPAAPPSHPVRRRRGARDVKDSADLLKRRAASG
jgi:hypothetical protein